MSSRIGINTVLIVCLSSFTLSYFGFSEAFNFVDELEGFALIADAVGYIIDAVDDCKFACPSGLKPVPNRSYRSVTNGCGSYGFTVELKNFPELTECCNEHDECYDTCGAVKASCENKFRSCLRSLCSAARQSFTTTGKNAQVCIDIAKILGSATSAFGCTAFQRSQQKACVCSGISDY